jgi:glycosyltransferase involved in cell wall biosynthesis
MPSPAISLLVSTYNWPQALALVLESVRRQRQLPAEVVIADDGSGEETRTLLVREQATFPVPLVHVWHEDRGFRLAAIRNRAIAAIRHPYVVQIDGDILLHPAFIAAHQDFARPGSWVQGSRALLGESVTSRLLAGASPRLHPMMRGLNHRPNAIYAPMLAPFVRGPRDATTRIRGAHMAFWRADLVRTNGYDEQIEGWGREDSELAARLSHLGVQRRNLKFAAVAYHLWHTQANFDRIDQNHQRLLHTLEQRSTRAALGLDQYLAPEVRSA